MATVTLNYNTRNLQAKNVLNYILSTGWFMIDNIEKKRVYKIKKTKNSTTQEALFDAINGNVIDCGSYENYLKTTKQHS